MVLSFTASPSARVPTSLGRPSSPLPLSATPKPSVTHPTAAKFSSSHSPSSVTTGSPQVHVTLMVFSNTSNLHIYKPSALSLPTQPRNTPTGPLSNPWVPGVRARAFLPSPASTPALSSRTSASKAHPSPASPSERSMMRTRTKLL